MKMTSSSLSLRIVRHLSTATRVPQTASSIPISISEAKSKLRREHDPDKALEILSSVSEHGTFILSYRDATELTVQRLAKAKRFDEIKSLINAQLINNTRIKNESYYSTLIRFYGKAGMFDSAVELYDRMEECGTPRTNVSFNALLAAGNNCRVSDKVRQLFDELPAIYGFSPDKYSYGILIKACCEKGDVEMGVKLLKVMEEKGIEVTNVCFNTILDALYRKGMTDEASRIWGEMVGKGCGDVTAWNVRIGHAHANPNNGSPEDCEALIDEMRVVGLEPDTISYNYLLACYCRNNRMAEAMKLFEKLEGGELRTRAATFRIMIQYLCKKKEYGKGYDVFKKSVVCNKIPDFRSLKVLVEGLVYNGMNKDAMELIRTVKKKFPPNSCRVWEKLEVELDLVSDETLDDDDFSEAQEATS